MTCPHCSTASYVYDNSCEDCYARWVSRLIPPGKRQQWERIKRMPQEDQDRLIAKIKEWSNGTS